MILKFQQNQHEWIAHTRVFLFLYFTVALLQKLSPAVFSWKPQIQEVWTLNDQVTMQQYMMSRTFRASCLFQIVGCDHELGSTTTEDNCGVCNGDGSSCRLVRGHYKSQHSSGKSKESTLFLFLLLFSFFFFLNKNYIAKEAFHCNDQATTSVSWY